MKKEESLEERLKAELSKDKGFEEKFKKGFKEYFGMYMGLVKMLEKHKDRPLTTYEIRKFLKKKTDFYYNLEKREDIDIKTPVPDLEKALKIRAEYDSSLVSVICDRYSSLMRIEKWGKRKLKKVKKELDGYSEAISLYEKFSDYKSARQRVDGMEKWIDSCISIINKDPKKFGKGALKIAAGIVVGTGIAFGLIHAWDYTLFAIGGMIGGSYAGMAAAGVINEQSVDPHFEAGAVIGGILGAIAAPTIYYFL